MTSVRSVSASLHAHSPHKLPGTIIPEHVDTTHPHYYDYYMYGAKTSTSTITIDTTALIHTVDPRFASFTIDASQWRKLDLHNTNFTFLAKQLSPSVLRVGGTQADYDVYQFGNYSNLDCNHLPSPMTNYRCRTVNASQWKSLVNFSNVINADLVYGLNDLYGRPTKTKPETKQCTLNCPSRNQNNLKAFLKWNHEHMDADAIYGYELGNELNDYFNGANGAKEQAKDLYLVQTYVNELYQNESWIPNVIGPDTHSSAEYSKEGLKWLTTFVKESKSWMAFVTFHMYSMGNGPSLNPNDLNASFLNATALNKSGQGAKAVVDIVGIEGNKNTKVWAGETASANNGGQSGITDTYINGFWYLDELGSHAAVGVDMVLRQTLENSGGYPLLENYQPLPDYWLVLLHKRIMGNRVLKVGSGNMNLRVYGHCSVDGGGGVALAWLNIGEEEMMLDLPSEYDDGRNATLWVLEPGERMKGMKNPLQSQFVQLNGVVLELMVEKGRGGSLVLPNLSGKEVVVGEIVLPASSYGFLRLRNGMSNVCT